MSTLIFALAFSKFFFVLPFSASISLVLLCLAGKVVNSNRGKGSAVLQFTWIPNSSTLGTDQGLCTAAEGGQNEIQDLIGVINLVWITVIGWCFPCFIPAVDCSYFSLSFRNTSCIDCHQDIAFILTSITKVYLNLITNPVLKCVIVFVIQS